MTDTLKKISKIRTGGQSGADRAAMDFARERNIPLCGWCPKNGWAEDYPDPPGLLKDYPELTETPSAETAERTRWNMRDCDAILTVIPGESKFSQGTETGLEEGRRLGKPMFTASGEEDLPEIIRWIQSLPDGTELCVGGPRASECAEAYKVTKAILEGIAEEIPMGQKNKGE
ncbi:MAG: molybdenum cofactor carrier [Firmicutes bacterium]|nr:molybdenum cofactor carrier [Bacillota bacterium]